MIMTNKKHDNKNTTIVLVALIAISIGIGVNANLNNETSVDPQMLANIATLVSHEQDLRDMGQATDVNEVDIKTLTEKYMNLVIESDLYLEAEDLKGLEARVLIAENAITTLSANRNTVPNQASETLDFNLVLLNLDSIEQDTFNEGDIIYISGNAGVSEVQQLSIKIRAPDNEVIVDRDFSIPSEGRFTTVFVVPAESVLGKYTITVSGGSILESINFDVRE